MARQLLVGTRKGLFLVGRRGRDWRIERAELLGDPVTMVLAERDGTLHARAGHGPLRREDEALARRRRDVGRAARAAVPAEARRRRRPRSDAQHADPVERHEASGRSKARSATASSGAARFRAASSTRATAATAGSSSKAFGSIRTASSGSAAAPTIPASTRSSSTRAAPTSSGSASRAAASGSAPTAANRGTAKARACAPTTRRPIKRTSGAARTRIASRNAPRRPTTSGSSITTASSAAPTAD